MSRKSTPLASKLRSKKVKALRNIDVGYSPRASRYLVRENSKQLEEILRLRNTIVRLEGRCADLATKSDNLVKKIRDAASLVVKEEETIETLPFHLTLLEEHEIAHRINRSKRRMWAFCGHFRSPNAQLTYVERSIGIRPPVGNWNTIVSDMGLSTGNGVASSSVFYAGEGIFPFTLEGELLVRIWFGKQSLIEKVLEDSKNIVQPGNYHRPVLSILQEHVRPQYIVGPERNKKGFFLLDTDKKAVFMLDPDDGEMVKVQDHVEFPCRMICIYKGLGVGMMNLDSTSGLPLLDLTSNNNNHNNNNNNNS